MRQIKVYKMLLKGDAADKAAAFYACLPDAARERADKKKSPRDKLRTLGCLFILSSALTDAGLDISSLYYTESGKPCVKGAYISLSHKGDMCVCALSDTPVGIDVEKPDARIKKAYAVLSEREKAFVNGEAEKFYLVFSKKEAAVKLTGEGLKAIRKTDVFDKKYYYTQMKAEDYIITVCSSAKKDIDIYGLF